MTARDVVHQLVDRIACPIGGFEHGGSSTSGDLRVDSILASTDYTIECRVCGFRFRITADEADRGLQSLKAQHRVQQRAGGRG